MKNKQKELIRLNKKQDFWFMFGKVIQVLLTGLSIIPSIALMTLGSINNITPLIVFSSILMLPSVMTYDLYGSLIKSRLESINTRIKDLDIDKEVVPYSSFIYELSGLDRRITGLKEELKFCDTAEEKKETKSLIKELIRRKRVLKSGNITPEEFKRYREEARGDNDNSLGL